MPRGVYVRKPKEREAHAEPVTTSTSAPTFRDGDEVQQVTIVNTGTDPGYAVPPEIKDSVLSMEPPGHWSSNLYGSGTKEGYGGVGAVPTEAPEPMPASLGKDTPMVYCRRCGQAMQCYGNLEGKIIPTNPPEEEATWACHPCKVRRKIRRVVDRLDDWRDVLHYEWEA